MNGTLDYRKTPFPWFGGKTDAAPLVWSLLGDVPHYVEPFFGGGAVLLLRPHPCNRTYYSETVNDLDGLLCNTWRAIQFAPDATAEAASWPMCEADLTARHLALVRWRTEERLRWLAADPANHDPVMAGWWLWGICSWIGGGWCDGRGPWAVGADGRIYKQARGTRVPGVCAQRPHLSDDGKGVNHAGTREPGVSARRPHLGSDGQGVNRPQLREPGVGEPEYHPMTMPELRRWFQFLSARLRHVRVVNGDWRRVVTTGAALTLPVRQGKGPCGIFLDPPYSQSVRNKDLYVHDSHGLAEAVRAWCLKNGGNKKYRIVLAGFAGEGHEVLEQHGWRVMEWFKPGHLKGGMKQLRQQDEEEDDAPKHQQDRERLWVSPHCLDEGRQMSMFTEEEA